jgi:hypothetical protein
MKDRVNVIIGDIEYTISPDELYNILYQFEIENDLGDDFEWGFEIEEIVPSRLSDTINKMNYAG